MNIGKISAVTIASPDLSKSVEQYVNFLNYRLVDEGQVSKDVSGSIEILESSQYEFLRGDYIHLCLNLID
mgnify:CR=1 FL=1